MTTEVVNISRGKRCDIVIDRRSRWGNTHPVTDVRNRECAIAMHLIDLLRDPILQREAVAELSGKRLGCHCAPEECHGLNYSALCDGGIEVRVVCVLATYELPRVLRVNLYAALLAYRNHRRQ